MSEAALIAHHIASNGVTVCPPRIAAYGHTPGLQLPDGGDAITHGYNDHPLSAARDAMSKARSSGQAPTAERNRKAQLAAEDRRAKMAGAYDARPTSDTIEALAKTHGVSLQNVVRSQRQSGRKNVTLSASQKQRRIGKGNTSGTSEKMNALLSLIEAAASAGIVCPQNTDIAVRLDWSNSMVSDYFLRLIAGRRIKVNRHGAYRVVTIVATGASTKRPEKMMG